MHPIIAESTGTRWIAGARENDFTLSTESVLADIAAHQPDLVFLRPEQPHGNAGAAVDH